MNTLDTMIAAKARRDVIRALIIKELRAGPELSADLEALLMADSNATTELTDAVAYFEPFI